MSSKPSAFPIPALHRAGWPFVGIAAAVVAVLALIGNGTLFMIGLILAGWVVYFFRDPERTALERPGIVISPADGRVLMIQEVEPEESLGLGEGKRLRISIFLSVFDVHVNRSAAEGVVEHIDYRAGKFLNASLDKASVDNERNALAIRMTGDHPFAGQLIGVVQIAGLVARRILCTVKVGQSLNAGERFGLIRFGSRTDIYLPQGMKPLVRVGQRMVGGETILACARPLEGEI